jgi:uncharacterized protein YcfL
MMIRSSKIALIVAAAAAIGFSAGCDDGARNVPRGTERDKLHPGKYPQMVSMEGLDDVVGAQYERVVEELPNAAEGKVLRVTVPVRCLTGKDIRVQYRFIFMDAQGRPVERNEVGWKYQVLPPRVERFLEGNALDTNAVAWRLEIRSAQ